MTEALIVAVLAIATVFLVLGILAGCTSLLGWFLQRGTWGRACQRIELEEEKEMVALFSALYAAFPRLQPVVGNFVLQLDGEKRRLQIKEWAEDHGIICVNGKFLEVKIEERS